MKIYGLLLAAFISTPKSGLAQQTYPYKTIEYIAADGRVLAGPEGADHRIERTFRDSLSGTVRRYDAEGHIREITPYADMGRLIAFGARTTFYVSGQIYTKEDLVANKREGEFLVLYPDGKPKRRETYAANERQTSECFAPDGSPLPCTPFEVLPTYKGGGSEKIVRAIQANVRYPSEALRDNIQGRVYVSFRVTTNGKVEDVKVVKGVAGLNTAAVEAVRKLQDFTPGTRDGEVVAVTFTLPVNFSISRPAPPVQLPGRRPGQNTFGLPASNSPR